MSINNKVNNVNKAKRSKRAKANAENQEIIRLVQACNLDDADVGIRSVKARRLLDVFLLKNEAIIFSVVRRYMMSRRDWNEYQDLCNICRMSIVRAVSDYSFDRGVLFVSYWSYRMHGVVSYWRMYQSSLLPPKGRLNALNGEMLKAKREGNAEKIQMIGVLLERVAPVVVGLTVGHGGYGGGDSGEVAIKNLARDRELNEHKDDCLVIGDWTKHGGLIEDRDGIGDVIEKISKGALFERGRLTSQEIKVIKMSIGDEVSLRQIGDLLGVTHQRVEQVRKRGLAKLRGLLKMGVNRHLFYQ